MELSAEFAQDFSCTTVWACYLSSCMLCDQTAVASWFPMFYWISLHRPHFLQLFPGIQAFPFPLWIACKAHLWLSSFDLQLVHPTFIQPDLLSSLSSLNREVSFRELIVWQAIASRHRILDWTACPALLHWLPGVRDLAFFFFSFLNEPPSMSSLPFSYVGAG